MARDDPTRHLSTLLAELATPPASDEARIDRAVRLASALHAAASREERATERARRWFLGRLASDDAGQAFVSALADRVHRSDEPTHASALVAELVTALGVPRFLPPGARTALDLVARGLVPPAIARKGLRRGVRLAAAGLVHDADGPSVAELVAARARERTVVNVNLVGEVVLGEADALARVALYERLLAETPAAAVSIKLSSITSRIALADREATVEALRPRLASLYRAAMRRAPHVLVNLDMESFDDLDFTFELHRRLVEDRALDPLTTGVVLQAYLPDAHARYAALLELAERRVARGGAPLRVRLVKGANLTTERHLASLRGFPMPIHATKADTDASFLALVERATRAEHARALRVGVASHNLFDLAFALALRAERGTAPFVTIEMLDGMADPLRRVIARIAGPVLVYAPVVAEKEFDAAIAYLVRRLEEATAPGHHLREFFTMARDDPRYAAEEERFVESARRRTIVDETSRRDVPRSVARGSIDAPFANEPDTDWAVARAREPILAAMRARHDASVEPVASIVQGEERRGTRRDGHDPSRPGVVAYGVEDADAAVVDAALETAVGSRIGATSALERANMLLDVARGLRVARASLIATMVLDGGKRVTEADAEVSEAIDFAEYYARSVLVLARDPRVRVLPRGPILVASPWNFPLAIGAGGVFGALAAGNPVLLKPSPKTPLVARELVRLAHRAGVPADALALLVVDDRVAAATVRDPRLRAVVLTGSTATARAIRRAAPALPLFAETGGKNAMIVTARADRDLAIKDAVQSAFGHAGQKCSAMSLLVCERTVYDDPAFRERLADATTSLPVGSAWSPANVVTPLIERPRVGGPLARALASLEPGESWLVPPRIDPDNPALVSPAIKLGATRGSFTHQTELFGPVLAVMRADSLDDAIAIANGTPYGLTGAIQSLDRDEQSTWLERIEVGNAYVNRGTTGAIVQRQPFGGTKASCFGPGAKAGGPSYVRQLAIVHDADDVDSASSGGAMRPSTRAILDIAAGILHRAACDELARIAERDASTFRAELEFPRDPTGLPTQRNLLAHVPRGAHGLGVMPDAAAFDVLRTCVAAGTCGLKPIFVVRGERLPSWLAWLAETFVLLPTDATTLAERLASTGLRSIRIVGTPDDALLAAAADIDLRLLVGAVPKSARDALGEHLEERSLCIEDHRYGRELPPPLRARAPAPFG